MANIQKRYDLFIDGKFVPASDGKTFEAHNPANGEVLASFAEATREDVDLAVKAARRALKSWRRTSPIERQNYLLKIADIIDQNAEHLALVETLDNGKPIRETMTIDVPYSSDHFRYFAGAIRTEEGSASILKDHVGEFMNIILHEPIGVVGQIVPWNFPFLMAAWKLAPALAAGDCIVFKPSSTTSLSVLTLVKLIGHLLPPGVLNVVTGGGSRAGQYMLDHPGFRKLAFTGSTEVGLDVAKAAADKLIPSTLELGGKSPCIVDETADITVSARRIIWGKLLNAGQTCVAPDYVLAHEKIYDKLIEQMKKYIVGFYGERPLQDGNYPKIINEKHYDRLASLVKASNVIYGGGMNPDTCQIEPTLIQADWDSEIMKDEIFGPLLPVLKFSNLKEVADAIKDRPKPLALYYFTTSAAGKDFITRNISYGGGCINDTIVHLANPNIPFGGVGASGMGNYHGKESFKTFSHRKSVLEKKNWLDLPIRYAPNSPRDLKLLKFLMK